MNVDMNYTHAGPEKPRWTHTNPLRLCCLLMAVTLPGCQGHDPKPGGKTNQGMVKSSGQFTKGYQEGMKQAQKSWGDWNGAGMWMWMADAQYKQGYDRGWNDGRTMVKLRGNQKSQLGTREPLT